MFNDKEDAVVYLGVPREKGSSITAAVPGTESKLGGSPEYFPGVDQDQDQAPFAAKLSCDKCQAPLAFVLQVYAPVTESKHRALYLFGCNSSECKGLSTWRVVRCQATAGVIPTFNITQNDSTETVKETPGIWSFDAAEVEIDEIEALLASQERSSLKSDVAKVEDTEAAEGSHEGASRGVLLDVVEEPGKLPSGVSEEFKKYEVEATKGGKGGTGDGFEGEKYEEGTKEELALEQFQEHIQRLPQQCLRYAYSGSPLWPIPEHDLAVRSCESCGAERKFELQVLPSALYLLGEPLQHMDWSSVLVFSCSESCDTGRFEQAFVLRPI